MNRRRMAALIVCLLLVLYTGQKLWKMCAIRGWVPGARGEIKTITGKLETVIRRRPIYWIAWDHQDPAAFGPNRANLALDFWKTLAIGDPLEVRYVDPDPTPYLENDIYVSAGNFGFDCFLLSVELGGVLACSLPLWKRKPPPPRIPAYRR